MTAQGVLLVFGVLIAIVAVIVAGTRMLQMRRLHLGSGLRRTLVLRETIALDPRRRIHLIECGERRVLLLTGGAQDLVLGWMKDT